MKKIGNDKIEISEAQDSRFWIHSKELGYGKWIHNSELQYLIGKHANTFGDEIVCKRTNGHALTVGEKYKVLDIIDDWVTVIDDDHDSMEYPIECFDINKEFVKK